jgi:hypothetical protein
VNLHLIYIDDSKYIKLDLIISDDKAWLYIERVLGSYVRIMIIICTNNM